MTKGVLLVIAAMRLLCPHMNHATRVMYASIITEESIRAGIDPLLPVAVVQHESRWIHNADNGKCVGLGQVCLSTQSACKDGLEALACRERRAQLFDGPTNIRTAIRMLGLWRKRCLRLTGRVEVRHILSGYAGTGDCGKARDYRIVREILTIHERLKNHGHHHQQAHPVPGRHRVRSLPARDRSR
jgi:Transglycosylase SLT domain